MEKTLLRVRGDGVELAVYRWGNPRGVPVLLVHGYPDNHRTWLPLVNALADEFQVFAYDVRGCGASDKPRGYRHYRLRHLGRDLEAVLRAISPSRPVHLVAHDWGSIQAWETVTEPHCAPLLASYTSISGPCLDHVGHWMRNALRQPGRRWAALGQLLHSWYIAFFHLPWLPELSWRLGMARLWPGLIRRLEGVTPDANPCQLADGCNGVQLYRANFFRSLTRPRQRATQVPVQLIVPTRDLFVRPALFEELPRWTEQLQVREVPTGHWRLLIEGKALATWVREFVRQREGALSAEPAARKRVGQAG